MFTARVRFPSFLTNLLITSGLFDTDWEQQMRNRGAKGERGGDGGMEERGCGLPSLPKATPMSVTASNPSPYTSPSLSSSPSPQGWRLREGEVAAVDAAAAISGAKGAASIPPPCLPLLYSISTRAPEEEAADHRGLPKPGVSVPGCGPSPGPLLSSIFPSSPMEPLPTQGQTLRHYTASRPRPRRTHTEPPSSRLQVRTHIHVEMAQHFHLHVHIKIIPMLSEMQPKEKVEKRMQGLNEKEK